MVIYWTFYNTPSDRQYFEAHMEPSMGDMLFSFNLAVHTPGDSTWVVASPNYMPGLAATGIRIEGQPGQELFLLVKDEKGTEKRLKYLVDEMWVDGSDIGNTQNVAEYRRHFVESLGINEEEIYCESIRRGYLELKQANISQAQINSPIRRGTYQVSGTNVQDGMKIKALARELVNKCSPYFEKKPMGFEEIKIDAE